MLCLPQENSKLREQSDKQKRSIKKLEEQVMQLSGKKKFSCTDAFSHTRKENKPLGVANRPCEFLFHCHEFRL